MDDIIIYTLLNPSVLWQCRLGDRKSIRPVKIEWWGAGVVICLKRGADCLRKVQLMPLPFQNPPTSLALFQVKLVLRFWYQLTQVVLEKRLLNGCSKIVDQGKQINWRIYNIHGGPRKLHTKTHGHKCQILTDFQNSLTARFCNKFAVKWLLRIPPHLAYVATLSCETIMSENKPLTTNYKVE